MVDSSLRIQMTWQHWWEEFGVVVSALLSSAEQPVASNNKWGALRLALLRAQALTAARCHVVSSEAEGPARAEGLQVRVRPRRDAVRHLHGAALAAGRRAQLLHQRQAGEHLALTTVVGYAVTLPHPLQRLGVSYLFASVSHII